MNNSDFNDFKNWQNGDDEERWHEEMKKYFQNNGKHGFFYYHPMSNSFKKLWEQLNSSNTDPMDSMKEYLNIDDIMNDLNKGHQQKPRKMSRPNKPQKTITFSQEEYFRLIEIRGYLAITEQRAHVKALDKVISQIQMVTNPFTDKDSK